MSYTRFQALTAATKSPWTKDLRHVTMSVPRTWARSQSHKDPRVRSVKPKDRIKWWNIVPGDQVRLLGDSEGAIHEVQLVNKLTNRVLLKAQNNSSEDISTPNTNKGRQVPYSRCQLFVGNHQFPPLEGQTEPTARPVFATRLATTKPHWLSLSHRYHWERYAVNTVPRLPGWSKETNEQILVPWPKTTKPPLSKPTPYDTTEAAVNEVTYTPPTLPLLPKASVPRPPSEHEYIKSLANPNSNFDASQPIEVYVHKDLTNPHSRAKKQARWQAYQMYKRSLLKQYVQAAYKDLKGRTRREARAEATWKWKHKLVEERKAETKRRWRNRGEEKQLAVKKVKKARKDERLQKKLHNLVLQAAPNQVLPGTQPTM